MDICFHHGGATRNAQRKARERLEKLIDPSLTALATVLENGIASGDTSAVVRAAFGILDRCGFGPKSQVELTGANGDPIDLRAQAFRMEDFSVETRRMMLRDMREAAERRALQAAQDETEPIDVQRSVDSED